MLIWPPFLMGGHSGHLFNFQGPNSDAPQSKIPQCLGNIWQNRSSFTKFRVLVLSPFHLASSYKITLNPVSQKGTTSLRKNLHQNKPVECVYSTDRKAKVKAWLYSNGHVLISSNQDILKGIFCLLFPFTHFSLIKSNPTGNWEK